MWPPVFEWVRFPYLVFLQNRTTTRWVVVLFWSRIRESNPPSRLGKPLYYRYTNPALEPLYQRRNRNSTVFCHMPETLSPLSVIGPAIFPAPKIYRYFLSGKETEKGTFSWHNTDYFQKWQVNRNFILFCSHCPKTIAKNITRKFFLTKFVFLYIMPLLKNW